jgi:hypothetical protein
VLRRGLLVFVLLASLAAASASAAFGLGRLTEHQFVTRATKICLTRARQSFSIPPVAKTDPVSVLAHRLGQLIPIYVRSDRKLHRLKPPRTDRLLARRWLRYENLRLGELKKARTAARRGKKTLAYAHGHKSDRWAGYAAEISTGLGIRGCV